MDAMTGHPSPSRLARLGADRPGAVRRRRRGAHPLQAPTSLSFRSVQAGGLRTCSAASASDRCSPPSSCSRSRTFSSASFPCSVHAVASWCPAAHRLPQCQLLRKGQLGQIGLAAQTGLADPVRPASRPGPNGPACPPRRPRRQPLTTCASRPAGQFVVVEPGRLPDRAAPTAGSRGHPGTAEGNAAPGTPERTSPPAVRAGPRRISVTSASPAPLGRSVPDASTTDHSCTNATLDYRVPDARGQLGARHPVASKSSPASVRYAMMRLRVPTARFLTALCRPPRQHPFPSHGSQPADDLMMVSPPVTAGQQLAGRFVPMTVRADHVACGAMRF